MPDFAYTLMIPAGCVLGAKATPVVRYRDFSFDQQKAMLEKLLDTQILPDTKFTMNFEQHTDKRYHVHGTIFECDSECMKDTQRRINLLLGYASDNNKIFYFKKAFYQQGWDAYCRKHLLEQVEIPEHDFQ